MRIGRSVGPCRRAIITQRCCVESLAVCDSRGSIGPRQYCTVSARYVVYYAQRKTTR